MVRPFPHRRGEAGYNLVFLIVIITVMNIAVAVSLPAWSGVIRREKEEELIFRGLQYAEAIRIFHNRFSRLPVRLEELVEVKPRSIRQLWKEPMADNGKWDLIFEGMPGGPSRTVGGDPSVNNPDEPEGGEDSGNGRGGKPGFGGPQKGDTVAVGPILGVRSRSGKASFLTFNGKQRYDEWQFTEIMIRQIMQGQSGTPLTQPGGFNEAMVGKGQGPPDLSVRWIGRPLPANLTIEGQQPTDGGLPVDPMMRGTDPNQRKPRSGPGSLGRRGGSSPHQP